MHLDEQRRYVRNKIADIKHFAQNTNLGVDEEQFARLYDFLIDTHGTIKLRPFTTQVALNKVGVKWVIESGYVSVWFGPGDDWSWEAHAIEQLEATSEEDSDNSFAITYEHSGKCSFRVSGKPYYHFPDEVEELIAEPDTFDGEYLPRLKPYQYEIVWVTNKYDGMLSGYVRVDNKIHYCDVVEETEFTSNRMFAVYELSFWERLKVWRRYHWWHLVIANSTLWKYHWWFAGLKRHRTTEEIQAIRNKFIDTHTVVGYFER